MNTWLIDLITTFGISLLLTGILIPQILLVAFRKKLFDVPDERNIHRDVVPRLGGMAFMPAIFFSIACTVGFGFLYQTSAPSLVADDVVALQVCFIACAMLLLFICGLADDLVGVRYRAKFCVQIIAGVFIIASGIWICDLHDFLWIEKLPPVWGYMLTLLVIVFILNAINLIDGIDGLASGLGAIALLFYGMVFLMSGEYFYAILAASTMGTLVPFYYYNVFGDPKKRKKIFMGDTGSLTIGVVLATLAVKMSMMDSIGYKDVNPLVAAFAPLIIPGFDVVRVYIHRLLQHRNPFLPDKSHIHHKMLALGIPQRTTMVLILVFSALLITLNVIASAYMSVTLVVLLDGVVWIVVNIFISRGIMARARRLKLGKSLYD